MIMDPRDATRPCMHAERRDARAHHLHLHLDADDRALGAYKVTLGGTNARMQPALPDATPCPIPSHPIAGPPGPTFDLYSTKLSACRSIPARNLFCVPGVHLNQATQELCICSSLSPARPCLLLSLSTTIHLFSVCLCCPSRLFTTLDLSPSPYLACLPSFLKRWQHSVIASR